MKFLLPLGLLLTTTACSFHSTATEWNGRVGTEGKPVYIKSTTNVGMNLFVMLKVFGATDLVGMVDEVTEEIAEEGGDSVRIFQSESENYWYGFPPFTWIFTPVINTVTVEYQPSEQVLEEQRLQKLEEAREEEEDESEED